MLLAVAPWDGQKHWQSQGNQTVSSLNEGAAAKSVPPAPILPRLSFLGCAVQPGADWRCPSAQPQHICFHPKSSYKGPAVCFNSGLKQALGNSGPCYWTSPG